MLDGLNKHRYRRILLEIHPSMLRERDLHPEDIFGLLSDAGYHAWRMDHSPEATRRAAYSRSLEVERWMIPVRGSKEPLDEWPHILWLAPGVALYEAT
jgi:hypothetical protein